MYLHANSHNTIYRNAQDTLSYNQGSYWNGLYYPSTFKSAPHVGDTAAPQVMRITKEPHAVSDNTLGNYSTTYFTWLEKEYDPWNMSMGASTVWNVYVAQQLQYAMGAQAALPTYLRGGQANAGSLNSNTAANAHSPRITVANGVPWVAWVEDRTVGSSSYQDVHVKRWNASAGMIYVTWDENNHVFASMAYVGNGASATWHDFNLKGYPDFSTGITPSISATDYNDLTTQAILILKNDQGGALVAMEVQVGTNTNTRYPFKTINSWWTAGPGVTNVVTDGRNAAVAPTGDSTAFQGYSTSLSPYVYQTYSPGSAYLWDRYIVWPQDNSDHRRYDRGIYARHGQF
jgi:hypothetical protein